MKMCPACKVSKPITEFGVHSRSSDGLRSKCRECERRPARIAHCPVCDGDFTYQRRGPAAHICPADQKTHHWCHACKQARPHSEFFRQAETPTGLSYRCKPCTSLRNTSDPAMVKARKSQAVRARYGISLEEYDAHLAAAAGVCQCCQKATRKRLVLDHCHETGEVRGVLCSACNSGIGLLGDDIPSIERALEYLKGTSP